MRVRHEKTVYGKYPTMGLVCMPALLCCLFSAVLMGYSATRPHQESTPATRNVSTSSISWDSSTRYSHASASKTGSRTGSRTASESGGTSSKANTSANRAAGSTENTSTKRTAATRKAVVRKTVRPRAQMAPTSQRISEIQLALANQGSYQGEPTGKWDEATIAAMKQFQASHRLNPSGKLDALSLQKLGLGSETAGRGAPYLSAPPQVTALPSPVSSSDGSDLDAERP